MMALAATPKLNPALVEHLTEDARANLATALLCSLPGTQGLTLILIAMAHVEAHADDLYRIEFEKEC